MAKTTPAKARGAKASAKTAAKPATKRRSPAKKPATKAEQSAVLQSDLKKLEARLKRADTVTRKSVAAVSTIVDTLEARVKSNSSTSKAQLTRHVNALAARLDDQLAKTRDAVRQELRTAMSEGGLDRLEAAIASATDRVDAAEIAQADQIARINRHLADIARAVDARIAEEARNRVRDIKGVEARLQEARAAVDARIDTVERDSADALTRVGDQVTAIHDKLEDARMGDHDVVTQKVNELALQTQAELEAHQARLDARIAELEARTDPREAGAAALASERLREQLSAQIMQLQTRIEGLERDTTLQALSAASNAAHTPPTPPLPVMATPMAPDTPANPYAAQLAEAQDTVASPAMQPPVDVAPVFAPTPAADAPSHVPTEFDPAAFAASRTGGAAVVAFQPAPTIAPEHAAPPAAPVHLAAAIPDSVASAPAPAVADVPTPPDFEPAPLPGMPYANPAYADEGQSPVAVRITDDAAKGGRRLPVSGRALGLGALVTGVSVVALFTARSLLGGNPAPNPDARLQPMLDVPAAGELSLSEATLSTPAAAPAPAPAAIDTPTLSLDTGAGMAEPIGTYRESEPVRIDAAALSSLSAAADAGNPVAQFQLGLTRIEAGDIAEGAALLKQAADADQPAALYRLAKLHESGQGVAQDDTAARRLIERAARGGNRIAMHDLALYYTEGRGGLEADMLTARSWFEQAALRGVLDSQYNLALLSESADGGLVPNREDALFWYSVAASKGDQYAIGRRDALRPLLQGDAAARVDARVAAFTPRAIDKEANGIFGPQPWTATRTASAPDGTVRSAQALLAQLGYDVGTADGLMGARTRAAVMAFEGANGLPRTGRVDSALIDRLSLAAGV